MALAATCSITHQLWTCMPFALNKWRLDTPTALKPFLSDIKLSGQLSLQHVKIVVCRKGEAKLLRQLLLCRNLREVHIQLPHGIFAGIHNPWPALQVLQDFCSLPYLDIYIVSCTCRTCVPCSDKSKPALYGRWNPRISI